MKAISAGQPVKPLPVTPEAVAAASAEELPSSSNSSLYKSRYDSTVSTWPEEIPWESTVNVETTFSLAIKPVTAATP